MFELSISELALEYARVKDRIASLEEHLNDIKAQLSTLGEGKHDAGGHTVTVIYPARFDAKTAASLYTYDSYPGLYTPTLDRKKLETHLTAEQFAELKTPAFKPSIVVKRAES